MFVELKGEFDVLCFTAVGNKYASNHCITPRVYIYYIFLAYFL